MQFSNQFRMASETTNKGGVYTWVGGCFPGNVPVVPVVRVHYIFQCSRLNEAIFSSANYKC